MHDRIKTVPTVRKTRFFVPASNSNGKRQHGQDGLDNFLVSVLPTLDNRDWFNSADISDVVPSDRQNFKRYDVC